MVKKSILPYGIRRIIFVDVVGTSTQKAKLNFNKTD
jgi:hypothetical protein